MNRFHPMMLILAMLLLPLGCAGPPKIIVPAEDGAANIPAICADIYPRGQWQFAHAIQVTAPGGSRQTMIGVTRMSSEERAFECAMITLEGLVLFEATYDGTGIQVQRAVPPMDKPGFAQGMIEDILLIFFPPILGPTTAGSLQEGARICRYPTGDGGTQDVVVYLDGRWEIRRYTDQNQLNRTITTDGSEATHPDGFPARLELRAHGAGGYRLNMSMMEAVPTDIELED